MPWVAMSNDEAKAVGLPALPGTTSGGDENPAGNSKGPNLPPVPSTGEAALRGAAQGLTLRNADELAGTYSAAQKVYDQVPELKGVPDADMYATAMASPQDYTQARDAYRAGDATARAAHPLAYTGSEIAGGMLPAAAGTAALGPIAGGAALGAVNGLGGSDADLTKGDLGGAAKDMAIGAGLGGAAGLAGKALPQVLDKGGKALDTLGEKSEGLGKIAAGMLLGGGQHEKALLPLAAPYAAKFAGPLISKAGQAIAPAGGALGAGASELARTVPDAGDLQAGFDSTVQGPMRFAGGISHLRQLAPNFNAVPQPLMPYAGFLQSALAKGEDNFRAQVFVRAQTDPEFGKAVLDLNNAPNHEE